MSIVTQLCHHTVYEREGAPDVLCDKPATKLLVWQAWGYLAKIEVCSEHFAERIIALDEAKLEWDKEEL